MNHERLSISPAARFDTLESQEFQPKDNQVLESSGFDLSAFFGLDEKATEINSPAVSLNATEKVQEPVTELLVTLRDDANEAIATITAKVTAETFAKGSSLSSSAFSALSSFIGSCGVFCAHSLSSLGQVGSGLPGTSVFNGMQMPGFSVDKAGNFHLDSNLDTLSKITGISKLDLLSGKFSADDILSAFISVGGESISLIFGFGLVEMLVNSMFDSFVPMANNQGKFANAA